MCTVNHANYTNQYNSDTDSEECSSDTMEESAVESNHCGECQAGPLDFNAYIEYIKNPYIPYEYNYNSDDTYYETTIMTYKNIINYKNFIYNTYITKEQQAYLDENLILLSLDTDWAIRDKLFVVNNSKLTNLAYVTRLENINKLNVYIPDFDSTIFCLYNMDISLIFSTVNEYFILSNNKIYNCLIVNSRINRNYILKGFVNFIKSYYLKYSSDIDSENMKKINIYENSVIDYTHNGDIVLSEYLNNRFIDHKRYYTNIIPFDNISFNYIVNTLVNDLSLDNIQDIILALLLYPREGLCFIFNNKYLMDYYISNKNDFLFNENKSESYYLRSNELIYLYNNFNIKRNYISLTDLIKLLEITNFDNFKKFIYNCSTNDHKINPPFNNLDEFRNRLNYFISKDSECNLFENTDFENVTICGSCMVACTDALLSYEDIDNLYHDSDLDIMINNVNSDTFIQKALDIIDNINNNINSYLKLCKPINFIEHKIKRIINVRFYDSKAVLNDSTDQDETSKQYNINLALQYFNRQITYEREYYDALNVMDEEFVFNDSNSENSIEIKYKFKTRIVKDENILKLYPFVKNIKPFEIFFLKNSNIQNIEVFHLSCVRSYYTGSEVILLFPCILSMLLRVNLHLAHNMNVYNIIEKYGKRGYKTILTNREYNKLDLHLDNRSGEYQQYIIIHETEEYF